MASRNAVSITLSSLTTGTGIGSFSPTKQGIGSGKVGEDAWKWSKNHHLAKSRGGNSYMSELILSLQTQRGLAA